MRALHQIMIAHDLLFAGHGFVISQKIDGLQVAVVKMPAAIVEGLGNAMSQGMRGRHLQARRPPQ
jgi:hypothetical protein